MFKSLANLKKLKIYCQNNSIELVFNWSFPESYIRTSILRKYKYTISIDPYQSINNIVYTLLHEIGHSISFQNMPKQYLCEYRQSLFNFNYICKHNLIHDSNYKISKHDFYIVFKEEESAWEYGTKLAFKLGIDLPFEYEVIKDKALNSYLQNYYRS